MLLWLSPALLLLGACSTSAYCFLPLRESLPLARFANSTMPLP